jgi:segregation and condensation protein A
MAYQVALLNFTGPLDLLLQLIEQAELQVTQVSLAQVTDQYLEYLAPLHEIDPLELNWFVELASKLLYIKSQALLPESPAQAVDLGESRELEEQLARYRGYKSAAAWLREKLDDGHVSLSRPVATPAPRPVVMGLPPGLDLAQLTQAFAGIQTRLKADRNAMQPAVVKAESITTHAMAREVMNRLAEASPRRLTDLAELAHDREELVVLFLAILELARLGRIGLTQAGQFDDIMVHDDTR